MSWTEKCTKYYAGFWVPIAFTAAVIAGVQLIPRSLDDTVNKQPAVQPQIQITRYEPNPINFELYTTPQKEWAGTKLTIDRMMIEEWARYAPVMVTVPEISYTAPFPVETGAKSAETTFPQSYPLKERTYHFLVIGKDPKTGNAKELYRQVIDEKIR
jgi:hypothetical protein